MDVILAALEATMQKEVRVVYALIKLLTERTRSATHPTEQKDMSEGSDDTSAAERML